MILEVLTRHYTKRPTLLMRNVLSLRSQIDCDWIQTILVDEIGRGVEWANQNLAHYAPKLIGDYIWILDDDDLCIDNLLVAEVRDIVNTSNPDVIMIKCDCDGFGILPDEDHWMQKPEQTHIGMSCFIVKRELWQTCAYAWPYSLGGDYAFIDAVFSHTDNIIWLNKLVAVAPKKGYGDGE